VHYGTVLTVQTLQGILAIPDKTKPKSRTEGTSIPETGHKIVYAMDIDNEV
jgi:hypothetical protein